MENRTGKPGTSAGARGAIGAYTASLNKVQASSSNSFVAYNQYESPNSDENSVLSQFLFLNRATIIGLLLRIRSFYSLV